MHLSHDELRRWHRNEIPGERARVVAHLATCADCTAVLAELVRTDPDVPPASQFDPTEFLARGAGFAPDAPPRSAPGTRRYWPAAAAAAAAVLLVAAVTVWPDQQASPVSQMRGDTSVVTLTAPADDPTQVVARDALEFQWDLRDAGTSARLVVHDLETPERPTVEADSTEGRYRPTAEELARLRPDVVYRWFVQYRTRDGLQVTPTWRFRVR